jgi:23S rRNA (cytidine1920-2'-O)/16S rRNA (cytidine1409-2'-O)-methyltransferase
MILEGNVSVNGKPVQKPSFDVEGEPAIEIKERPRYVGRGGYKLEAALEAFVIDLKGKTCLDAGASTGGFTDCMLQKGALRVYAVENGNGQLDASLRADKHVISLENTDIRDESLLTRLPPAEFSGVDVSFISLKLVLPFVSHLTMPSGDLVCLIKPQFEAGREHIGKNGVVTDKKTHVRVLTDLAGYIIQLGLSPVNLIASPIKGGEGNIEYLIHLKNHPGAAVSDLSPDHIVGQAFDSFRKD